MPELAEVHFFQRRWAPARGKRVRSVHGHWDKRIFRGADTTGLRRNLPGKTLTGAATSGKQMLFCFGPSCWLGVHLGMTGKLDLASDKPTGKHDHLVIESSVGFLVFTDPRLFGRVRTHFEPSPPDWWTQRPPDILGRAFTTNYLERAFHRRSKSPLKALLLDQSLFPGIGNWMADEICWRAGFWPGLPAGNLNSGQIQLLRRVTRQVTRDAIRVIGTDWSRPPDHWLFNHRWEAGHRCPRCQHPLNRNSIAGRTTAWCSVCQSLF